MECGASRPSGQRGGIENCEAALSWHDFPPVVAGQGQVKMKRNRKGDQVVAVNSFTEDVEARADVQVDMASSSSSRIPEARQFLRAES